MDTRFRASSLPAKPTHVSRRALLDWSAILRAVSIPSLAARIDKWCAVFGSLRAHIRIQCAREGERVHVGPAYKYHAGHLCPDERTNARAEGIENLLATHPWVDSADLQVFLLGFDAGEKYGISARQSQGNLAPDNSPTCGLESSC